MRRKTVLLLLLLAVLLSGCGSGGEKKGPEEEKEGVYKIYYLNPSATKLMPQEYFTETEDQEALIQELMNRFLNVPNDVDSQVALSDKVGYLGYRQEEQVLFLYFDAGYGSRVNMNPTREILCRATIAVCNECVFWVTHSSNMFYSVVFIILHVSHCNSLIYTVPVSNESVFKSNSII